MPVPEAENTEVRGARTTSAVEVVAQVLDSLAGHSAGWWELREVLGMIGAAVTVDRVFVLENGFDPDTGMLVASMRAEWCADGVPAQIDNPRLQGISYEALGERWLDELSSGRPLRAGSRTHP